MNYCIDCERHPTVEFNGEKLCSAHALNRVDMSEREAPPIAYTKPIKIHPQSGASTSGTPRHYK